jgi:hypothetical protein
MSFSKVPPSLLLILLIFDAIIQIFYAAAFDSSLDYL